MATIETDRPLHESFDNGIGALSHHWAGDIDTSVPGEITLTGLAGAMQFPGGPSAGQGYGTYTFNAKLDGDGPGPALLLWPGDDRWPGQEIDIVEILSGGRQYGTVHWDGGGWDEYLMSIARAVAAKSKDPSTRVGAVIVDRHRIVRATGVRAQQQHRSGRDVSTRYRYETGFHGAGRKCCHGGVSEHRSGLRRSGPDLRRAAFRTGCRRPSGRMGQHAPRGAHKIVEPRRAARLP